MSANNTLSLERIFPQLFDERAVFSLRCHRKIFTLRTVLTAHQPGFSHWLLHLWSLKVWSGIAAICLFKWAFVTLIHNNFSHSSSRILFITLLLSRWTMSMAAQLVLVLFCLLAFAQLISAMPRPQMSDWTGSGSILDAMGSGGGGFNSYSASNHFSNQLGFNSFPSFGGYWGWTFQKGFNYLFMFSFVFVQTMFSPNKHTQISRLVQIRFGQAHRVGQEHWFPKNGYSN